MDINNFLIFFYKEQHFIFGICPCCAEIFQLSEASLSIPGKQVTLPELKIIQQEERKKELAEEKLEKVANRWEDLNDKYEDDKMLYDIEEPEIIKKVKITGRRKANNLINKFDSTFTNKKINLHDVNLLFYPVEYIVFPGMTDKKDFSKIIFYSKKPRNTIDEKLIKSIESSIQKGNIEFVVIRINEKGEISYE